VESERAARCLGRADAPRAVGQRRGVGDGSGAPRGASVSGPVALALCLAGAAGHAHPLGLGRLAVDESPDGVVQVSLRVSGTEQQGDAMEVPRPEGCARETPDVITREGETRALRARWRCPRGLRGTPLTVRGLEGSGVQILTRVRFADGRVTEQTLDDTHRALDAPGGGGVASRYLSLGAQHIAEGADHLAFALCLALWIRDRRALLASVTGFTAGHSVTLALSALGLVQLPQRPVEACIALSVALLALELAHGRPPPRRHALLSAAVGLLHGLGFASALREVGLPQAQRGWALLSFNVGVELGQIVFLAGVLSIGALARRAVGDPSRARRWVVEAVGACSVMWLLQRVMG
jgi:hydrogenase/urease accessory protein HupE